MTGTVTQICVDETARGAFREGLKAIMVSDAVSSFDPPFTMRRWRILP